MDEAFLIELVDGFGAESVDIHGLTAHEMLYLALDLGRTSGIVGAIMGCFALVAGQRATTFGAFVDETHLVAHHETGIHVHAYNLRDDFATLLYIHPVADVEVEPLDDVGIVQGGTLHHGSGQLHGVEVGHRSHGTGASHLVGNAIEAGTGSFGLEFVGGRS